MTGTLAWEFFEEELWPFLCFMFAHKVQVTTWQEQAGLSFGQCAPKPYNPIRENWLLLAGYRSINLKTLFQKFHSQNAETKNTGAR